MPGTCFGLRSRALRLQEALGKLPPKASQRAAASKNSKEAFEAHKTFYRQQATTWVIAPQLVSMVSAEMPTVPGRKK